MLWMMPFWHWLINWNIESIFWQHCVWYHIRLRWLLKHSVASQWTSILSGFTLSLSLSHCKEKMFFLQYLLLLLLLFFLNFEMRCEHLTPGCFLNSLLGANSVVVSVPLYSHWLPWMCFGFFPYTRPLCLPCS